MAGSRKNGKKDNAAPAEDMGWVLDDAMLEMRMIRLDGEIDEACAAAVTMAIRYLEAIDPTQPITLVINSPGGSVTDGMAIVDTMRNCLCPIHTCVYGQAASMASIILAVGNQRYAAPHAEIMIHQPLGGLDGQQTDVDIYAQGMRDTRELMTDIYAQETGLDHADLDQLMERDYTMTASRALQLGFIDAVMTQELYFKLHGKKVPEAKKPRFPDARRKTPRPSIEDTFNDMANRAASRKQDNIANDNATPAAPRKTKNTPHKK